LNRVDVGFFDEIVDIDDDDDVMMLVVVVVMVCFCRVVFCKP